MEVGWVCMHAMSDDGSVSDQLFSSKGCYLLVRQASLR
jgi:hypothetical protein